jgi:hypothetical protein
MHKLMVGSVALLATLAVTNGGPWEAPGTESARLGSSSPTATVATTATPARPDLSLPFVENRGQFPEGIAFHAPGREAGTYVTEDGEIVYALPGARLTERFAGGAAAPAGLERARTRVSSFVGNDPSRWVSEAATYRKVGFGAVWPGIEVDLHARQGSVEKFFTVAPGVSPDAIELEFDGARALDVADDGRLVVALEAGEVAFSAPIAFQEFDGERRSVPVAYTAHGHRYGFAVGDYDRSRPLVIDPTLVYSTLGGGNGLDNAGEFIVDAAGAVYVAGETTSTNLTITGGPFGTPADVAGGLLRRNGFLAKLAPDGGSYEFYVYVGGFQDDRVHSMRIAPDGSIFLVGATESDDLPVSAGAAQPTRGGDRDFFVAKLNGSATAIQYLTYLGGPSREEVDSNLGHVQIELDSSGRAYIYGGSEGPGYPVTANAPQPTFAGQYDAVLTRIAADGSAFEFSTYLGGPGYEYTSLSSGWPSDGRMRFLAVRDDGRVWVVGRTGIDGFPTTPGAAQTTTPGNASMFVASYETSGGTLRYSTFVGGNNVDTLLGMYVDTAGRVTLYGGTRSSNFPTTPGAYNTTQSTAARGFIVTLNEDGRSYAAGTFFGGSSSGVARVRMRSDGSLVMAGYTGSGLPVTPGAYRTAVGPLFAARMSADLTTLHWATYLDGSDVVNDLHDLQLDTMDNVYVGISALKRDLPANDGLLAPTDGPARLDAYLLKLSADGTSLVDAGYVAGSDDDSILGLHLDAQQRVYLVGATESADFPTTAGAADRTHGNRTDLFIVKMTTREAAPPPSTGTIAWTSAVASVSEAAGTVTLTATRSGGSAGAASVQYATASGTATAGTDFAAASGALNWADGESGNKTVTIAITNDAAVEPAETFTVALANAAGAILGTPATVTVTINDDDVPPPGTLALSAATYSANEGQGSITISVTRTGGTAGAASVNYAATAGTATAGADFTATSGTLNWADGDGAAKTFTVAILDDSVDEPNETVTLALSQATGATLGTPATATLTIVDNDAPATTVVRARGSYGGGSAGLWLFGLLGLLALRRRPGRAAAACLPLVAGLVASPLQAADAGWYAGARGGVATSSQGSSELNRALANRGTGLTADVDDQDFGGSVYVGYEFAGGLALEVGYVDLGEYTVKLDGDVADPSAALQESVRLLGSGGGGFTAVARWNLRFADQFEFAPRAGLYYWDSENELRSDSVRVSRDESGTDFTGGVSLAWRPGASWSLGVAWDYYAQSDRNDVNVYGLQVEYRWP